MSQQEDDLRALAKIMDFLRAVSIILVVMNVYWFCYEAIRLWGVDIGVVAVSYTHLTLPTSDLV